MKKRHGVIGAALALGLTFVGLALAPAVANRFAASEVDRALERIRRLNTAVASRGEVDYDLFQQSLVVRDVAVDSPGAGGAKIQIGRVTVHRPGGREDRMVADTIRIENVTVAFANETLTIPTIEVDGYEGPAQGLVSPPRVGRAARTQADMIAQVSIRGARAPEMTSVNADLKATRTIRNVVLGAATDGVVSRATIESVEVSMLPPPGVGAEETNALHLGAATLEGVSLPTLMRFQAGDGQGEREIAVARAEVQGASLRAPTASYGVVNATVGRLTLEALALRPLAFPTQAIDQLADKARSGKPLTPADVRQMMLMAVDGVRAVAIGRAAANDATLSFDVVGPRSVSAGLVEATAVADGRVGGLRFEAFRAETTEGSAAAGSGAIADFDATGLLAYAQEVGDDKILLTSTPPADRMMGLTPRAASAELANVEITRNGDVVRVGKLRTGQRGDVASDLPNHISVAVEQLQAPLPPRWRVGRYLQDAGVEEINLSFAADVSLDATTQILKLEQLAYDAPGVADVSLTGSLANVDPKVAVERGGELVEKLSDVTVDPFALKVVDHGGLAAALAYAADRVGRPPDVYREDLAQQVEQTVVGILGPSADASGRALALFIRKGGALDVAITPKGADTRLLRVLGLIGLGPVGLAQALDLTIVTRDG
ncbi:hypothetical protein JOD31_000245 [Methylopila capsulata]|uniref:Uncharacterized protein n=1 Tax=Methylopila capsulata TaxID=61654 RepID=A0A9W6ITK3_9HYPH|nr:hypothetical protein [Methylopila capsulata]MBM7850033.1 hypothetical protein [Methylopila capsulata]GLK55324.1 hypothetical protein GCM10008170_13430 [Methylopila capsulata]